MKLRLPNKLITALLSAAAPALFSTLSTATLGAAAVGAICQQAEAAAEWNADGNTNGHAYYYLDLSGTETEIDTLTTPTADAHDFVNRQDYVTDNYATVGIVAGVANQQVHIGKVAAANGQTFMIAQRPWNGTPNINVLIDTLEYAAAADSEEEYGSGSFTVNANQTATLKKVNGTLTSLTNDGTLTLDGTFEVTNSLTLGDSSHLTLAKNSSLTYSAALEAEPLEKILNKTHGEGTLVLTLPEDGNGMEMYGKNFAFNVKNTVFQGGTDGTYMLRINSNGSATKTYNISAEQSLTFNNAYLRLEGDTTMNVSGSLTVTGRNLQLGHTNSGGHYGRLNILEGANVVLNGIKVWDNTSATDNNQLNMSGGVLQITGSQMFDGSSTMNTTAVNFTGGTLKADGNSWMLNQNAKIGNVTMNATGNATLTVSGTLSNADGYAGSITKTGTGTLKLSSANTYSGGTTINDGTLEISNVNALGSGAVTGSGTLAYKGDGIGTFGASFADTWTGMVSFDDVAMQGNLTLAQFGNASSSIYLRAVRGTGTTGVVLQGGTVNSDVCVENSNLAAFEGKIANGAELTFAGSFSGKGSGTDGGNLRISVVDNGTASITFAGDVSGWKSSRDAWSGLHVDAGTLNAIFTAADTTVNAHLVKESSNKLNVVVGDGTNASNVTFTQKLVLTSLTVKSGSTAKVIASENKGLGNVSLSGSSLLLRADGGTRTFGMDSLSVSGTSNVNIEESTTGGQGWHATVNIGSVNNAEQKDATIKLGNAARAFDSVYNLNGGSLAGEIIVNGTATTTGQGGAARRMAVQLNAADVAKNSVITFDTTSGNETKNKLGLGIGADVSVKGIQHAAGSSVNATIYSGKITETGHNDDFASIGTEKHTITITGGGDYETSAKIDANLNIAMSGKGTQTFTGDMSAFNGDITANDGNLVLKNLGSAASFELNNLTVKDGATVSGYTGAAIDAAQEATISVAGTLTAESGAILNANLIVKDGATINVSGEQGLTMGSTVTFEQGANKISLGSDIISGLNSLTVGNGLTLFSGVEDFYIGDADSAYNASTTYHAGDYFNLAGVNRPWDFVIKYEANAATDGGTVSLYMETPEPATATLSLLALAALAAKRKRK